MRILEFICPRCRETIRAAFEEQLAGQAEESLLVNCSHQGGCGWFGYLPLSRGVAAEPEG